MARLSFSFLFIFLLGACDRSVEHKDLIGIWKSNAELTLESLRQSTSKNITKEHSEIWPELGFGEEIYEFKNDKVRLSVDSKENRFDFTGKYGAYNVLEVTDEYFKVESYDILFEKLTVKKLFRDGDCFYEYMPYYEFKNYYCRDD